MKVSLAFLGLMAIGNISVKLFFLRLLLCVTEVVMSHPQQTKSYHKKHSSSFGERQEMLEPPQFLIDLYSGDIENFGSKLEGASRVVAVSLHKGVKRGNNKFFLSFKRPEIYRVRSVKLALTKFSHPPSLLRCSISDKSSTKEKEPALRVFQKMKGTGTHDCFRPIFQSQKYDIFNVTEFFIDVLDSSNFDDLLEFNMAYHCCCGRSPSWVGDFYQLESKRTQSPLLLFYDDVSTGIWNNSVIQETMSEDNHFLRNARSVRSVRRVYRPTCKLRPWIVNIKDLGWSHYVYAPTSFQINYCRGECRFLGNAKATHHALIKYLFLNNRRKGKRNKRILKKMKWACCVPDQFQSIDVIYQDTDGSIVYDEWDNVRAVSCGCH